MVDLPNPDLDWVYFVELSPLDPAAGGGAGAVATIDLATVDVFFDQGDPSALNREYEGIVDVALSASRGIKLGPAGVEPDAQPNYGAVTLKVNEDFFRRAGFGYAWLKTLVWNGYKARVLRAVPPKSGPWRYASLQVIHDGVCAGGNTYGATEIVIPIGGLAERLNQELRLATYAGSGGFEGGADLKGKPKPVFVGLARHMEPVLVDPATQWWDLNANGGVHTLYGLYQGGFPMVADVNPPAAGKYYLDAANGRVRTNGLPTLPLTASFRSGFGAGAQTAADAAKAVLDAYGGFVAADYNLATFTALNTANGTSISGIDLRDHKTVGAAIDPILAAVGAFHTEHEGKIEVYRFDAPTATSETDSALALLITDEDIVRGGLTQAPHATPPYRIDLDFAPCLAPMDIDRVAAAAADAERQFITNAWRTVPAENAATKAHHKQSRPARAESHIDDATAAATEAARRKDMHCRLQDRLDVTVAAAPFAQRINAQVWVRSDFFGVNAAFRVISVGDRSRAARVDLGLWRPA